MQKFILATAAVSADAFLLRKTKPEDAADKEPKCPVTPCAPKPTKDVCMSEIKALVTETKEEKPKTAEGENPTPAEGEKPTKPKTVCKAKMFSDEEKSKNHPSTEQCVASGCHGVTPDASKNQTADMDCGATAPAVPVGCGENAETEIYKNVTADFNCENLEAELKAAMDSARPLCPHSSTREKEGSSSASFLEGF